MSDLRRTIETIRNCLSSTDLTFNDQLREAAEAYAEQCRQLNDRLGRCEHLLKQGLRAEALRQAEIDPDLLELASDLDFEGRDVWEERLMLNDVATPPAINRKAVEMLNRAYAEEAPLAELLKHHRLLALGRAPLRERVETVRLLAKAEPTNAAWAEDVASFEAARMEEMRGELRQIHQANDWPRMQALSADVASGWQTFLPLDLVNDIDREYKRQSRLDSEKKLKQFQSVLQQAVDTFDLNRAHHVRDMIERLCQERQINAGDVMMQPLQPLLDWVAEQDRLAKETRRFEKACRDLLDAVGQKAEAHVLHALYKIVADFRRPIPPEVERAYRDRLSRNKRKNILTVLFFVAALLLMLGCAGGVIVLLIAMGK